MRIDQLTYNRFKYDSARAVPPEIKALLNGVPAGKVEVLKERAKRSVFMVYAATDSDRPAYFLKYDHPVKAKDRIKGWVRPKVAKEYRMTRRLFDLGVPVVEPVFCARSGSKGIFVSRAIPDAVSFGHRWLAIKDDPAARQAFLRQWRQLLEIMLENNLYHQDVHSGNILTVNSGDGFDFFLVDAVDVRVCRRLSEKQALQSLKIVTDWGHWLTENERAVLLGGLPGVLGRLDHQTIQQRLAAQAVRQFYRKDWRHLRHRIFDKDSLVHIVDDTDGTFWINHETALNVSDARKIIAQHATACRRENGDGAVLPGGGRQHRSVVTLDRGRWEVIEYDDMRRQWWRGRRAALDVRGWFNLWGLAAVGLAGPLPLALFRAQTGTGYIITEYVAGGPLPDLLAGTDDREASFLFQMLYDYLRGLHTWKIICRQLQPDDFIVTADKRLVLTDWDDITFNRWRPRRNVSGYVRQITRGMGREMDRDSATRFEQWLATAGKTDD